MVGMADGYAQASGPADATSTCTRRPGVGNAMGAIFNAQANQSPLLVTAGQQVRALMTLQANLTNRDATRMPHPLRQVELRAAARRGRAAARWRAAIHLAVAAAARARRSSRSRWTTGTPRSTTATSPQRDRAHGRRRAPRPTPRRSRALAERLDGGEEPGAGRRPRHRRERRLGRRGRARRAPEACPCGRRPAPGGGRLGFPEGHPNFQGVLPPAIGPVAETLEGHDLCSSSAPRSSPTTRTSPGRCCPRAPSWSRSPATPTRRRARRWATRSSPTSS